MLLGVVGKLIERGCLKDVSHLRGDVCGEVMREDVVSEELDPEETYLAVEVESRERLLGKGQF